MDQTLIGWQEFTALLTAIWRNGVSLLTGTLGLVFTVASVWRPERQRRYLFIIGVVTLLLSPICAWLDEHRARRSDTTRLSQEKKTLTNHFDHELKKLTGDEKFRRATMRPTVELSFYYGADELSWKFWNSGPGVGIVKWFSVSVDGVPRQNWPEALQAIGIPWASVSHFTLLYPDTPIGVTTSAGPSNLLLLKPPQPVRLQDMARMKVEVCYCSLLEDCWLASTHGGSRPGTCKPAPKVKFRHQ
jgi:hypothetical protein